MNINLRTPFDTVLRTTLISSIFFLNLVLLITLFSSPSSADTAKEETTEKDTPYIQFDTAQLKDGRSIWMENCEGCHAYGIGDSPIPIEPEAWDFRIKKGKDTLYKHAIEGFFGPDDAMMPERGGNLKLTDDEVKAAVDYMVALASYYIEKAE